MSENLKILKNSQQLTPDQINLLTASAEKFIKKTFAGRELKKILFVHPPDCTADVFKYDIAKRGGYYNFPPYGLGVLAANVRDAGYDAKISGLHQEVLRACKDSQNDKDFDYDQIWQEKLKADLYEFKPDLVAVTCLFTMTYKSFLNVARFVKSLDAAWLGNGVKIPLVGGGVHITQFMDIVLKDLPELEFIIPNEGEISLINLCETINNKKPINELSGIVLNDFSNEVIKLDSSQRPAANQINLIPAFDLMQVQEYSKVGRVGSFDWTRDKGTTFASVLSNRGCRAACTFCNVRNFNGKGVRQREVSSVIDELKLLHEKYGVQHITWLDDDLLNNEKRAITLFNEIVKNNLKITWDAMNGVIAASCTDEVVSAMASSGCQALNIGVESGNAQIQHKIQKPGNSKIFLAAAQVFQKYESINARLFLMIGFPGESYRMIADTINLAIEMNLDWHSITILQPWLNTPMYEAMVEQGLIEERQDRIEGRYSAGPFGQQRGFEETAGVDFEAFKAAFQGSNVDQIPHKDQLLDIWFCMNYYLNFHRLFSENRKTKLEQQARNLRNISSLVAPTNGFGMYFDAYVNNKLGRAIDPELTKRLEHRLLNSSFWTSAFKKLGLSIEHLKTANFPQQAKANSSLSIEHLNTGWFRKQKMEEPSLTQ